MVVEIPKTEGNETQVEIDVNDFANIFFFYLIINHVWEIFILKNGL